MMTRRALLGLAGAAAGAGVLGAAACERPVAAPAPADDALLVAQLPGGLTVLGERARTRLSTAVLPAAPAAATPGLLCAGGGAPRLVRAFPSGGTTELLTHDLADGRLVARVALRGLLAPRAASPDGTLVALTAATVGEEPYRPAPRTRTTIVIVQAGGERTRIDLPGNLEPEAFSADGLRLFVLDYLPPTAPDRYRVRMLDLAQRSLLPLLTRAKSIVPAGAEEEMRGQGRQAVYDPRRQILFTLYTHQPGHQHTRDLVPGARPGAPHVHAFVHALSLRDQWAYCIDLPAPFGAGPPGRHAIALSGDRRRLAVVEAGSGLVAAIDPDGLKVASVDRFAPAAVAGHDAAARYLPDNALLVGAGREVVQVGPAGGVVRRWPARSPVRGLALHPDGARVYVGQYDAVVCHDVATGRELSRLPTPGLLGVQAALA